MENKSIDRQLPLIFLIEMPLFFLNMPRGRISIIFCLFIWVLICLILYRIKNKANEKFSFQIHLPLCSLSVSLSCGFLFYLRWNRSGIIKNISGILNIYPKQFCLILALFLAFLSIWGIDYILHILLPDSYILFQQKTKSFFFIFLTSFLTISLNSECSPLYPFNTWGDPNFMITVGKGVLKGRIPYRDLYEQKGPLLLFLHTIGASISFTSFTGIWILEVLFCFLFLLLSYKIIQLEFKSESLFLIPIISVLVYGNTAFLAGDSAEEFCLPMLAYGIYITLKAIKFNKLLSKKEYLLLGISAASVFWMKYSMIGFYLGWFIFMLLFSIKIRQEKNFWFSILYIFCGICLMSFPIIIYFAANQSVSYLFKSYFYNNLFIYTNTEGNFIQKLTSGLDTLWLGNRYCFILFFLENICFLIRKNWKAFTFTLSTFLFTFITVYIGGKHFLYYGLIFSVYAVLGIAGIYDVVKNIIKFSKNKISQSVMLPAVLTGTMIILCFSSKHINLLETEKKDMMQYRIKEIIENVGIENPTVMDYNTLCTGVNTAAGLVPNIRFFSKFNLPLDEIKIFQDKCFEEGCTDFVIIETREIYDYEEFEQYIHLGGFEGNIHNSKRPYYYHLYMRKGFR